MPTVTTAEIEKLVANPKRFSIKDIKVLRDLDKELPDNTQVGPTCGIYALDAALRIRGRNFAPRKQYFNDEQNWRDKGFLKSGSIRGIAKDLKLSKIGEISSAADMENLANTTARVAYVVEEAASLGVNATTKKFYAQQELWKLIVDAVNEDHAILMPYSCAGDDGAPAWSYKIDGFAHWCLLFGYVEYSKGSQRVFMTTYGHYHEVAPYSLFKANQRIQDWPRQTWIKLAYWFKNPNADKWSFDRFDWVSEAKALQTVTGMVDYMRREYSGWGFALGSGREQLHAKSLIKLIDPPNATTVNLTQATIQSLVVKSRDLKEVRYSQTMCGQCVVV